MGNFPSAVPSGAQIDKIDTTLSCAVLGQYEAWNFNLSTTAPLIAGSGQQIYYSDTVIEIDLPPVFQASFASDFPGNYSIDVNVTLDLTNASPASILINQTVSVPTSETHFRIPAGNGVLPPIGPVTLGKAGHVHRFELGKVDIIVNVGAVPISVNCVKQNPEIVIGSVIIDESQHSVLAPANAAQGVFPPTKSGEKSTIAHVPVTCQGYYPLPSDPLNLIFGGISPATLSHGQQFNISELIVFLVVGENSVIGYSSFYGGDVTEFFIELGKGVTSPGFGVNLTHATPGRTDVSRNFVSTNADEGVPLADGRLVDFDPMYSLPIGFPFSGALTIGPYTTAAVNSTFGLNFEIVSGKFSITGYRPDQPASGGYSYFNCTPVNNVELFSANVA